MMKLEEILEGAIGQRGRFTGYKPPNEKGEIKTHWNKIYK
jgi:hypothetical protein